MAVGDAVGAAELYAVAAADTAFKSRSSAFTPGRRKLAASTFVVVGGLGRRPVTRVPVGGEPRLRQACRARSLLAAAASSLSSLRGMRENERVETNSHTGFSPQRKALRRDGEGAEQLL